MFRHRIITLIVAAFLAGIASQATAQAAEKVFILNAITQTTFYDRDGNVMELKLDVEIFNTNAKVIGTMVTLNGVKMGYAPPTVRDNGSVIFWDARGAHITNVDGQYGIRLSDLGPWFSEKIGPVNTDPSQPPVQTNR